MAFGFLFMDFALIWTKCTMRINWVKILQSAWVIASAERFAKSKAQPAKKCLFFFSLLCPVAKPDLTDSFLHCCTLEVNIRSHFTVEGNSHTSFSCNSLSCMWIKGALLVLHVQSDDTFWISSVRTVSSLKHDVIQTFYKTPQNKFLENFSDILNFWINVNVLSQP